jgi:hypothetical protein
MTISVRQNLAYPIRAVVTFSSGCGDTTRTAAPNPAENDGGPVADSRGEDGYGKCADQSAGAPLPDREHPGQQVSHVAPRRPATPTPPHRILLRFHSPPPVSVGGSGVLGLPPRLGDFQPTLTA